MHAERDYRVPFSHSEMIYGKAASRHKELVALNTKRHTVLLSREKEQVFERVEKFIETWSLPEHGFQTAPGSFNA